MVTHKGAPSQERHVNGRHVKTRRKLKMSRKTLVRLTVTLYMFSSALAGALTELLVGRIG